MLRSFNLNSANTTKSKIISFTLITILTASTLLISIPIVSAQKVETTAYMGLRPNPIGVGQELLVTAWTSPTPNPNFTTPLLPGSQFFPNEPRENYRFTITKPDGTTETKGPFTSFLDVTTWFTYTPDQIGIWTFEFTWPGDDLFSGSTTGKIELVVQEDPIPSWPAAPLPTQEWNYPINPENREWTEISGGFFEPSGWSGRGYDSSGSRYNPYARAPNSAHILWKLDPISGMAGLIGQPYGQVDFYPTASSAAVNIVMAGKGYYQAGGMIYCVDINTGEELWSTSGSYTVGNIEYTPGFRGSTTPTPVLLSIGNRFTKYDALTGAVLVDSEGIPGFPPAVFFSGNQYVGFQNPYAFVWQWTHDGSLDNVLKIDTNGHSSDFKSRIVWNVTIPRDSMAAYDLGTVITDNTLVILEAAHYGDTVGIDIETGDILWTRPIDYSIDYNQKSESVTSGYGKFFTAGGKMNFVARDIKTGAVVWESEQTDYPWGNFWAYGQATAYDQVYGLSYAGVYAFDAETGDINWHYYAGDAGMETPYGTFTFGYNDPLVADGKVFAPGSEHTPTFYYRGTKLHVIDAYSGDLIWDIMGYYTANAVAQDKLFATNAYDGRSYCFGRGTTATTVVAPSDVVMEGESMLIKGSVMDMSPAQPNTPAVSDESMSGWMEYLHMQQPMPMDVTGVEVVLEVLDPNNNFYEIGKVTSDADGNYAMLWEPEVPGKYFLLASFLGSESYWSSHASTYVGVLEAPEPTPPPEPTPAPMTDTYVLGMGATGIVAIIAIGLVIILILRKK